MPKMGHQNMDDKTKESLNSYLSNYNYYVNANTGSDLNDGLTPGTAKKTLNAVSNIVSSKRGNRTIIIQLAQGDYLNDRLWLAYVDVDVIIEAIGIVNMTLTDHASVNDCKRLDIRGINFIGTDIETMLGIGNSTVTFRNCKFDATNKTAKFVRGLYAEHSKIFFVDSEFINLGQCMYLSVNTHVTAGACKFDANSVVVSILAGAIFNSYGHQVTGHIPVVSDFAESSIDGNAVRGSIIVERGSNANGTYEKYGDGRLVCSKRAEIGIMNGGMREEDYAAGLTVYWNLPATTANVNGGVFAQLQNPFDHTYAKVTVSSPTVQSQLSVIKLTDFDVLKLGDNLNYLVLSLRYEGRWK